MGGHAGAVLRAGLGLKIAQIKRATQSYVDDRTDHGKSVLAGYAVGAGLYAAAGVFMIAACLVGITALFRWIELTYGQFTAFGVSAAILIVLTALCALIAARSMRPPKSDYPSFKTRLSAALRGNPLKSDAANLKAVAAEVPARKTAHTPPVRRSTAMEAARSTASDVLRAPASPTPTARRRYPAGQAQGPQEGRAALILVATLLGWAVARRHANARNRASDVRPAS